MAKIKVQKTETLAEVFDLFILSKRAQGITDKTAATYLQHLSAISKHLDVNKDISVLNSRDLELMVQSMRNKELSPNSIRSYTITLKAFFQLVQCQQHHIIEYHVVSRRGKHQRNIFRYRATHFIEEAQYE